VSVAGVTAGGSVLADGTIGVALGDITRFITGGVEEKDTP
jgi:hypothetical protein